MKFKTKMVRAASLTALAVMMLCSQVAPREQPGFLPDGSFLLHSGWRVKPVGRQVKLDTLPMSCLPSKDGKYLFVLNGGYNPPSISVLSVADERELSRTAVPDAWLGMALSQNGRTLWVGGGSKASIFEFTLSEQGELKAARTFELTDPQHRSYNDFIGDLALAPDGHLLYAASIFHDSIVVVNPQSGKVIEQFKTGRRPYRILFHPDGQSFFVSSWADGAIYHHQTDNGTQLALLRVGAHPTDMIWRDKKPTAEGTEEGDWAARIFVSAANTNNVYAVAVSDSKDLRVVEAINVATTPMHPLGMTPSALAMSADRNRLYVVCSDANTVAVVDVNEGRSHVMGFVPVGWYPTAARALADGRLVVLNGKGDRSYPNPKGPNPAKRAEPVHQGVRSDEYVGSIQRGTASFIAPITDEQLDKYSDDVLAMSPYSDAKMENPGAKLPPLKHVIYIVKENRTYDQMLGDIGKGASDPSLVLFPEKISPNHHKLAREFVLLDNFYVSGDVSADGHNWSTASIASDYVQKFWPNSYAKRREHYDYEGGEAAATPAAGYIWTNALARGISMRNYGYFATMTPKASGDDGVQVQAMRDSSLTPVTNMHYRPFDLDYPDVKRVEVFMKDLAQFESAGKMPQFMIMRLGNDHTNGTTPGKLSPFALVADNDHALGMLVEAVSKTSFWKSTAIFVLEDDAQNGPDHIDSHRSPCFVISPYTRRGIVDSTMYNTVSVLRTIELILGMRPMTHFDAAARPMSTVFADKPELAAYQAEKPRVSTEERNPQNSATAARSRKLDFDDADLNDDEEMNDILWLAIRGTNAPTPVRSIFVR